MIMLKVKPYGGKHVQIFIYFGEGDVTPANLGVLTAARGEEAREVVKRLSHDYADPVLELDGCLDLPADYAAERLERG